MGEGYEAGTLFKLLAAALERQGPAIVKELKGVYAVKVTGGPNGKEAKWVIDLKNGNGSVEFEGKTPPDVTFSFSDSDLIDMVTGKLNAQKAFFQGKLKIQGNMGMAMKLQAFQNKVKKVSTSKL